MSDYTSNEIVDIVTSAIRSSKLAFTLTSTILHRTHNACSHFVNRTNNN